jgi:hypothetical protein
MKDTPGDQTGTEEALKKLASLLIEQAEQDLADENQSRKPKSHSAPPKHETL